MALRPFATAGGGSAPAGLPARDSGSAGPARAALLVPGVALAPPADLAPAPGGGLSFAPGTTPLRRERRPGAAGGPGDGGAFPARLGERGAAGVGARPAEGVAVAGRVCRSLRKGLAGDGARCSRLLSASGCRWWWRGCWPAGCGLVSGAPPPAGPFSVVSMARAAAAIRSSGGRCSGRRRRRRRAASPRARSSLTPCPARRAPRAPAVPSPALSRPGGVCPLAQVTGARVLPVQPPRPLASPCTVRSERRGDRRGFAHTHTHKKNTCPATRAGLSRVPLPAHCQSAGIGSLGFSPAAPAERSCRTRVPRCPQLGAHAPPPASRPRRGRGGREGGAAARGTQSPRAQEPTSPGPLFAFGCTGATAQSRLGREEAGRREGRGRASATWGHCRCRPGRGPLCRGCQPSLCPTQPPSIRVQPPLFSSLPAALPRAS